jgi:hypothetical protein
MNLTFVKAHFEYNKDFIVKNLCINRFNLDSDCEGKCILMKKLTKEVEKEAEEKAVFSPLLSFSFFHENAKDICPKPFLKKSEKSKCISRKHIIQDDPYLKSDYHPPEQLI